LNYVFFSVIITGSESKEVTSISSCVTELQGRIVAKAGGYQQGN